MEKIKRFINCSVPVNTCTLRCHYCYITQTGKFSEKLPVLKYTAEHIGKALSRERMGGICHIICAEVGKHCFLRNYLLLSGYF